MSRPSATPAGFFGKLPSRGDFVSRNLPPGFVRPWDSWASASLAEGRRMLGEGFLHRYLLAPVWRFALSPGLSGSNGWIGVLATSVDAVGRCFPLTLATELPEGRVLTDLTGEASRPLADLARVALHMIDGTASLERASEQIGPIAAAVLADALTPIRRDTVAGDRVVGWMTHGAPHASIAVRLTLTAKAVEPGLRSVWWHDGWAGSPAETIVFAGLPEPSSFQWLLAPGDADIGALPQRIALP